MTAKTLLIGDIGGTNARFAMAKADSPEYFSEQTLTCADYATADSAIQHYLDAIGAPTPQAICLAAAGPIVDQQVRFTNNPWTLAVSDLQGVFDIESVRLLNDFEAIAYCVPFLSEKQLLTIGLPDPRPLDAEHFIVGVIGPGTGLGTVGLRKFAEHYIPIVSEAGHVGFAPETHVQMDILARLRERFDRVSAERVVSGPGLENLYWALCGIHGDKRGRLSAAQIFATSANDRDPRAIEAVETFFEILGQVAGDLALTLRAADGIFIAGGVARRYPERLTNSRFRSGFEAKGRYRTIMERIPTQLITHEQPGLLGAAYCVRELANMPG